LPITVALAFREFALPIGQWLLNKLLCELLMQPLHQGVAVLHMVMQPNQGARESLPCFWISTRMWPQGGNRVKRNGEKVTETVADLFFFRNDRFWPIAASDYRRLLAKSD